MYIVLSNQSEDPIYAQIVSQIKEQILKGELKEGDSLPSIRSLAKDLQISVITTKRAYEELEKEKLIETVAGKGSFVASHDSELLRERRMKFVEDKLLEAVEEAKILDVSLEEMTAILKILYEEVKK